MTFTECSIAALKAYWRTAVVIDDNVQSQRTEQVKQLNTPRRSGQASQETERSKEFQGASLNVPALVDAFLQQSILCTVFDRKEVLGEGLETLLRSDILVLDWKLGDDGSSTAKFISECASKHPNALHMICIYTSEPNLGFITEKLKEQSHELEEINTNDINSSDNTTEASSESEETKSSGIYSIGSTYVLVVNKGSSQTALNCRSAEEKELPKLLFQEFAPLVGGLLRNAVFHSIGAIRNNIHALLDRFHPEIDPAFISHRVYSNPCADTEQHIIPLIYSQIGSILSQENIPQYLNIDYIKSWLNFSTSKNSTSYLPEDIEATINSCREKILTKGIMDIRKIRKHSAIKTILQESLLTSFFGAQDGQKSDAMLSILMSYEYRYSTVTPILKSGTMLKLKDVEDKYLLCIQPPCDCVRIEKNGRQFLFAHVSKTERKDKFNFQFINKDGKVNYLAVNNKAYKISLITFKPDNGKDFISAKHVSGTCFFTDKEGREYELIFQLNELHALRNIQECSNNLSRIGLMESDWQRRCAKGEHIPD